MKDVYAIYESRTEGRDRSRWVRVGVAFDNKDGSLNVLLDACRYPAVCRSEAVRSTLLPTGVTLPPRCEAVS